MTIRERKNVYMLPPSDTTLEWYAKAVAEMRRRPSTDPTSWNYQAAIHGIDTSNPFWAGLGTAPSSSQQSEYWNQCQHGTWYFLPWHRMYLAYFEQIVSDIIVELGGPAGWSLPFWNYSDLSNPDALNIPPAFTSGTPDINPLQMPPAGGIPGRENNSVLEQDVTLGALTLTRFSGAWRGASPGFGGPVTSFSHSGGAHGGLEHLPHDFVHVDIGNAMGDPDTAALDPIFWLHHANIDRLWQVWLNQDPSHTNPTESNWLSYSFDFHDGTGKPVSLKASDVLDTTQVLSGYAYQDVPPTTTVANVSPRVHAEDAAPEVLSATNAPAALGAQAHTTTLDFLPANRRRASLHAFAAAPTATAAGSAPSASEAYLNFENITGTGIPPVYDVYLDTAGTGGHTIANYVGSLPFFGVASSSRASEHHNGSGQQYVLDISAVINRLRADPSWRNDNLHVRLQPRKAPHAGSSVTIGRISLYVK